MFHAFLTIAFFLSLDMLWIKLVMKPLYLESLYMILMTNGQGTILINMMAVIGCYIVMLLALFSFVIMPLKNSSLIRFMERGSLLGFCLYGTYALTCFALFNGFTAKLVLYDILWGSFLFGSTAVVAGKLASCRCNPKAS
jgi:uncharacterized membrane protein